MTTQESTAQGATRKEQVAIQESKDTQRDVGSDVALSSLDKRVSRETDTGMQATYSPEDNKLRLYSVTRLDAETYARVKGEGFGWAAKQGLFFAMWTPARADLLIDLCGDIGDEDTSLVDRAEVRAERFEGYRDNRVDDAESALAAVAVITNGIPLGQPILVGHHSERHATRDAKRIENGMRKAVQMWETAKYWKSRAAGAIRHAKYKEQPEVRARRIKTIEADRRKAERNLKQCQQFSGLWLKLDQPGKSGEPADAALLQSRAMFIANVDHISRCFPLSEYPRELPASQYEGSMSVWSALKDGIITPHQARDIATAVHEQRLEWSQRWIAHYDNRLAYERAMLDEQGAANLLEPKKRAAPKLPLCNYRAPEGITCENRYNRGQMDTYPQVEMTQAQYTRINKDFKATRVVENSHRIRTAMMNSRLVCVFLTDSKVHVKPAAKEKVTPELPAVKLANFERKEVARTKFDELRDRLKDGVQVTVAPQLFPTPHELVQRMIGLAEIKQGDRVLEPSAGTGRILEAIHAAGGVSIAVEINHELVMSLRTRFDDVRHGDFMACHLEPVDAVVMNPPFANGQDIEHITHAFSMVKPGGRLVAICANGPRQERRLRWLVEQLGGMWEVLPADTFKESGTRVNTVLLTMTRAI